ncbi:hypothetical protein GCM10023206_18830 [Acinetobacter puyangensis]|uniref:Peptidase MA superfamily protein n=1 Tax=Acinetobacter puyangensis TaxID=1096779 RepID=A0A240E7I0_9GAMM|nr:hypothetical protein [Acinetobacter puyangensis]SNX43855.1 hypothetical protein SAMN05421731_10211 [Acinetobacter puyangensis]
MNCFYMIFINSKLFTIAVKILILLILGLLFSIQIFAKSPYNKLNDKLDNLNVVYLNNKIRVYYSNDLNNIDFIVDRVDINRNNIPDYVENIAIQANATLDVLNHLGFINPLESQRYKGVAQFIDIHLISVKGNGVAYEMPAMWGNKKSKQDKIALLVVIRNNIENFPGDYWTTVTHELFHLYQYGYSQFKGGWYLEGMANWAERSLRAGAVGRNYNQKLPQTQAELEKIYNTPYNHLWHRLAVLSDKTDGTMKLPQSLLSQTYVDGSKVFKDDKLRGYKFMRRILENLTIASNEISIQNNRDPYYWAEKDQRSALNRPIILRVIQQTMHEFGMNKTSEEKNFLQLK